MTDSAAHHARQRAVVGDVGVPVPRHFFILRVAFVPDKHQASPAGQRRQMPANQAKAAASVSKTQNMPLVHSHRKDVYPLILRLWDFLN